jgi:tripartite-type tricarboxylate transporter receptor subunit TctC
MDEQPPEMTPDSATLASADVESGQEILDTVTGRRAFAAPPGLSESVTQTLRDAYEAAINDEEFLGEAEEAERPIDYATGEATRDAVNNMIEQWENNPTLLDAVFY